MAGTRRADPIGVKGGLNVMRKVMRFVRVDGEPRSVMASSVAAIECGQ